MTALPTSQEALSANEIAELDRRWTTIEAGEATVLNDIVVRWLRTWGTPALESWDVKLESSAEALTDLDRCERFLRGLHAIWRRS